MIKLKVGDQVKVIAGRDRGKIGSIKQINGSKNKVIVTNCNIKIKHNKPVLRDDVGSIVQKEAPIHISNVMVCDSKNIPSRIQIKKVNKNNERFSKKTGEKID